MSEKTLRLIKEYDVKWIDLRFTDTRGKEHHVTVPKRECGEEVVGFGRMFDGSSMAGWKDISDSDMMLMPDDQTAVIDPFTDDSTLNIRCSIVEPTTGQGYERDPRSVAQRADALVRCAGRAVTATDGAEPA